jgi:dsDNA-specific endonuclease/ATPase MutS2
MAIRNLHREERSKVERILTQIVNVSHQPIFCLFIILFIRNVSFVNLPFLAELCSLTVAAATK